MNAMRELNLIKQLKDQEVKNLINKEADGQTPLDFALCKCLYPQLSSLLTEKTQRMENDDKYKSEINDFVELITVLLDLGAEPGVLKNNQQNMNIVGQRGMNNLSETRIRHCRLGASELGLAVTVWKNATGSTKTKAEDIVRTLYRFVENRGVHDIVREHKPELLKQMCKYLSEEEVTKILNKEFEHKTSLDVALDHTSYPNLSNLVAYEPNLPVDEETLETEVTKFVTMTSILIRAGARPSRSRDESIGITHSTHGSNSSKLAMAIVAWDVIDENKKNEAEKIVKKFRFEFKMKMRKVMGVPQRYLPQTMKEWNSKIIGGNILGRISCKDQLSIPNPILEFDGCSDEALYKVFGKISLIETKSTTNPENLLIIRARSYFYAHSYLMKFFYKIWTKGVWCLARHEGWEPGRGITTPG